MFALKGEKKFGLAESCTITAHGSNCPIYPYLCPRGTRRLFLEEKYIFEKHPIISINSWTRSPYSIKEGVRLRVTSLWLIRVSDVLHVSTRPSTTFTSSNSIGQGYQSNYWSKEKIIHIFYIYDMYIQRWRFDGVKMPWRKEISLETW